MVFHCSTETLTKTEREGRGQRRRKSSSGATSTIIATLIEANKLAFDKREELLLTGTSTLSWAVFSSNKGTIYK